MRSLSEIEKLAKESRNSAIRSATTLVDMLRKKLLVPKEHTTELIELMVDGIITAAMMEIATIQMKIVEDGKK